MFNVLKIALAFVILTETASAQDVRRVPYTPLTDELGALINFETLPKKLSPGLNLDGVQTFDGASFAEGFHGQILSFEGGFDRLTGMPADPLMLRSGVSGQNLAVAFFYILSNQLIGHAPPGFPARDANGEGAISILFDEDQYALGFQVAADPKPAGQDVVQGQMQVSFFRRNGSLIAQLITPLDWGRAGYGFRRQSDVSDIAGITITNSDPAGIAIDDVIFDRPNVLGSLDPSILPDQEINPWPL